MNRFVLPLGQALFLAVAVAGCQSSTTSDNGPPSAARRENGVREVPASQLAPLTSHSPTSDPHLEAAGPEGWKRLPRNDEKYLIGFYGATNPNVLPRIFVRKESWKGGAEDTTPENVTELAAEIGQSLQGKGDQVLEPPQAMLLAGEPWVRYVENSRLGNARAEKQVLQRVVNGQLYTVELQIYYGKILESRDQAYAVAAGLKVQPADAGAPSREAPEETPGDAPVDSPLETPDESLEDSPPQP